LNILSGSFAAQASIPLDEQWIVGQYTPQNFDITQRAYMLQMAVKIVDDSLQKKIMYDPAGGSAWLATMLKDGTVKVKFSAAANAGTTPTRIRSRSMRMAWPRVLWRTLPGLPLQSTSRRVGWSS